MSLRIIRFNDYVLYTDQLVYESPDNDLKWILDGYVLPKTCYDMNTSFVGPAKFLPEIFSKYGEDFIKYIKGCFTLIQCRQTGFKIVSDHFGIKKFFIYSKDGMFIISNHLYEISKRFMTTPSFENMAIYALTYHFIGGITIFKEINYNNPAQLVEFIDKRLFLSQHWDSSELFNPNSNSATLLDLANLLTNSIVECLWYNNKKPVSLSLTAGVDSRLLFSILKDRNKNLHTYTYGDPQSIDCKLSKRITDFFKTEHGIHHILFDKESFSNAAFDSIKNGQSLCSLHRAHRLRAIEREAGFGETMFLGTMGGEFVKGANRSDYIISDFVYEFSKNQDKNTLIKYLKKKSIILEQVDTDLLMDFFKKQNWCRSPHLVEFYGLTEIATRLHHAQNDILYNRYFKYVFTPFTDVDFLSLLFQSEYHFLLKKEQGNNFKRRLSNHKFGAEMQNLLCKELANFPYNSGFVPKEYLQNRIYSVIRAGIRKNTWINVSNFPLNDFMNHFVLERYESIIDDNSIINSVFDTPGLLSQLKAHSVDPIESHWLKYTTPVQMDLTLKFFS